MNTINKLRNKHKFSIQEDQYEFPYHYIPNLNRLGHVSRHITLSWGYDYLCYIQHIVSLVKRLDPRSVLDVGCGDGRFLGLLDNHIHRTGVDLSERAIGFARIFNPDIKFHCCNISDINDKFELVTAIEVLEHIPDEEINTFILQLFNHIKDNGFLIISVPSKILPLTKKHYRHYDLTLLNEQLSIVENNYSNKNVDYIYGEDRIVKLWAKLTTNRYWHFFSRHLETLIWRHIWHNVRFSDEYKAHHIIVTLKKK